MEQSIGAEAPRTPELVQRASAASVTARTWLALATLGLAAEIAWTVESTFLNLFVHDVVSDDPHVIATMVAASAATATLTAFVFGPITDRIRNKHRLLAITFILWGFSTAALGAITFDGVGTVVSTLDAMIFTGFTIVVLDCVMSLFGAGAHRAAYHGWVTEMSNPGNRGKVEALIVTLPLVAMLISFLTLDRFVSNQEWSTLFATAGIALVGAGLVSWWLIANASEGSTAPRESLRASVLYGMRWRTIRAHPELYLSIGVLAMLSIATTVYFPYLLIYVNRYLGIDNYASLLGIIVVSAVVLGLVGGTLIDRIGRVRMLLPAVGVYAIGLMLLFFASDFMAVAAAGIVTLVGFLLLGAASGGLIRDYSPAGRAGGVQGTRVLLASLPAAMIGPYLGAAVITGANTYYEHLGELKQVPTPEIFVAAAAVLLLAVIPSVLLRKRLTRTAHRTDAAR